MQQEAATFNFETSFPFTLSALSTKSNLDLLFDSSGFKKDLNYLLFSDSSITDQQITPDFTLDLKCISNPKQTSISPALLKAHGSLSGTNQFINSVSRALDSVDEEFKTALDPRAGSGLPDINDNDNLNNVDLQHGQPRSAPSSTVIRHVGLADDISPIFSSLSADHSPVNEFLQLDSWTLTHSDASSAMSSTVMGDNVMIHMKHGNPDAWSPLFSADSPVESMISPAFEHRFTTEKENSIVLNQGQSSVTKANKDYDLPPIVVRDPNDPASVRRARNTEAARRSRAKKMIGLIILRN